MNNINRDYLIVLDVKSSTFSAPTMYFYNTDVGTSNIYVQLVIKETIINANGELVVTINGVTKVFTPKA